jgi:hypothetical protein
VAREEAGALQLQMVVEAVSQVVADGQAHPTDVASAHPDRGIAGRHAGQDPARQPGQGGGSVHQAVHPALQDQGDEGLEDPRRHQEQEPRPERDPIASVVGEEPPQRAHADANLATAVENSRRGVERVHVGLGGGCRRTFGRGCQEFWVRPSPRLGVSRAGALRRGPRT